MILKNTSIFDRYNCNMFAFSIHEHGGVSCSLFCIVRDSYEVLALKYNEGILNEQSISIMRLQKLAK